MRCLMACLCLGVCHVSLTDCQEQAELSFWELPGNYEIWVMNADGSGQTNLTNNDARDWHPAWSPDGTKIAFDSDRDGDHEIYVMDVDGSDVTQLTNNSETDRVPTWSPDGSKIAFGSGRGGNADIYVINADGSGRTKLSRDGAWDFHPVWSPAGDKIGFMHGAGADFDIRVMNADGSDEANLTDNDARDWDPAWSPDGSEIAFDSDRDGNWEIYVMTADGSEQTRLTNSPADDTRPAWSPDGSEIAFESNRDGDWQIWAMGADGSGPRKLVTSDGNDGMPIWSPDGGKIAFVRVLAPEGDLGEARAALRGAQKDASRAERLLLEVALDDTAAVEAADRFYAYVYLGYLADGAGRRKKARSWYRKALEIDVPDPPAPGRYEDTRRAAEQGLRRPITWISHLDEGAVELDRAAVQRNLKQAEAALAALRSWVKDLELARRVLLEIDRGGTAAISPADLCRVYVYLGYIADREVKREEALSWYGEALEVEHAGQMQKLARQGLERPLTWIRQFDQVNHGPAPPPYVMWSDRIFGTDTPVPSARPAKTLSRAERVRNFEILAEAIGQVFTMFEPKGIDWPQVVEQYRQRLDESRTTQEFYFLLHQLVAQLRDGHSRIANYSFPDLTHAPVLGVDRFGDGAYVVRVPEGSEAERAAVEVGSEIIEVDGMTVDERSEQLRHILGGHPSEHYFRRHAYRDLLRGREGTDVHVKVRAPDGDLSEVALPRVATGYFLAPRARPPELTPQRFVRYGRHPSGMGYIHIRSLMGDRKTIADELETALTELRRTPALILDIRENGGGGGSFRRMVSRFTSEGTGWKYLKPVALLTNCGTICAPEMFASHMRRAEQVVTVGSPTAGSASWAFAYVLLPSGLVVRVAEGGGLRDETGRFIEGIGHEPDVFVEPTIEDFLAGRDPVIDKAVEVLRAKLAERE